MILSEDSQLEYLKEHSKENNGVKSCEVKIEQEDNFFRIEKRLQDMLRTKTLAQMVIIVL